MDQKPESADPQGQDLSELGNVVEIVGEYLGASPQMADRREYVFFLTTSLLYLLGLLAVLGYIFLGPIWAKYYPVITDKEQICNMLVATGSWGPVVYILIQALQVVVVVWPFPVEVAGGFLFGMPLGIFYSMLGLTLGSVAAFVLGRWLERKYITEIIAPEKLQRFQKLMKREGTLAAFMIFLIPAIPKDFVCYILGLSRMSLKFFIVAVAIARLPTTVLYSLQGAQAYKGDYWTTLGLVALYLILGALMYRHRDKLYHWISQFHQEN